MKLSPRVLALFVVLFFAFWAPRALHAQGAALSFAGGNGTPLTLTLAAPVTYTITNDYGGNGVNAAPYFLFEGIGNQNFVYPVTGTMTYSINGGAPHALTFLRAGGVGVKLDVTDWYVFGPNLPGVSVGDTVTLNQGSLTTSLTNPAAPPSNGLYFSYIFDTSDNRISTVSAPEPSTWMLMVAGTVMLAAIRHRRALWLKS